MPLGLGFVSSWESRAKALRLRAEFDSQSRKQGVESVALVAESTDEHVRVKATRGPEGPRHLPAHLLFTSGDSSSGRERRFLFATHTLAPRPANNRRLQCTIRSKRTALAAVGFPGFGPEAGKGDDIVHLALNPGLP
jgi:hypothetical protein